MITKSYKTDRLTRRFTVGLLTVAAVVFLGAGCGEENTATTNTATSNQNSSSTPGAANTKTFDMTASQFEFSPSTILVKKGNTVQLHITATDTVHGFALPEFSVNKTLTTGKTTTIEFVADKAGTFTFSCSVVCGDGHADMTGKLIVEE